MNFERRASFTPKQYFTPLPRTYLRIENSDLGIAYCIWFNNKKWFGVMVPFHWHCHILLPACYFLRLHDRDCLQAIVWTRHSRLKWIRWHHVVAMSYHDVQMYRKFANCSSQWWDRQFLWEWPNEHSWFKSNCLRVWNWKEVTFWTTFM